MTRDEDLYEGRIREHYEEPFHLGHCPGATHVHEGDNPLCGDVVRLELAIDADGTIADAYFSGEGCRISRASASMLVEAISGCKLDDARQMTAQQMLDLFGARLTPNRQKCCLLSWRVLQAALFSPIKTSTA